MTRTGAGTTKVGLSRQGGSVHQCTCVGPTVGTSAGFVGRKELGDTDGASVRGRGADGAALVG